MNVPICVMPENGVFCASLLGKSETNAAGATPEAAVAALRRVLQQQVVNGELAFINIEPRGLERLGEKFKDDPAWHAYWDDIVTEIYRERDEQKKREFPE